MKNTPTIDKQNLNDILVIFNNILTSKSCRDIADELNIAIGTVERWKTNSKIPKQYIFQLMNMLNMNIDYSKFTFKEKDQIFTNNKTATYCFNKFKEILLKYNLNNEYTYIEPSAGDGSFLEVLPKNNRICLDIEPRHKEIIKKDFLNWYPKKQDKYACIGNPPFGLRGQLALKFINHASKFCDWVCFILPQMFESDGKGVPRKRVTNLNLVHSEKLNTYFYDPSKNKIKVECIFQIWSKFNSNPYYSIKEIDESTLKIYSLSDGGTPSTTRNKKMLYSCDIYIPSTCFGKNNMKYYDSFNELPRQKGYGIVFKKNKITNITKFKKLDWFDIAFLSTNSAYNIRISQIAEQFK